MISWQFLSGLGSHSMSSNVVKSLLIVYLQNQIEERTHSKCQVQTFCRTREEVTCERYLNVIYLAYIVHFCIGAKELIQGTPMNTPYF